LLYTYATHSCFVSSSFKAANGAVRVQAYDDQDSREYQMLLIPSTMHELDLELPPTYSDDNNQWLEWAKLVVPRLELTSGKAN
jgi:hypothetical protein